MRQSKLAIIAVSGIVAFMGCGSDDEPVDAVGTSPTSSTEPPTTACDPAAYEGDALTDPCGSLQESFDEPEAVPAACDDASYRHAVSSIDGNLRILDSACDGDHLVARYGSDACAPESDLGEDVCINAHTAYFVRDGDRWMLDRVDDPSACGAAIPLSLCAEVDG